MDEEILEQFKAWLDTDNIANAVYQEIEERDGIATLPLMQQAWLRVCEDLYLIIRDRL